MAELMIVDDDPGIRFIVKKILTKEGYDVSEAESGENALEKLKVERPNLILLDIMMPGIDGWETCRKIKDDDELKSIPVVILTVRSSDSDKSKSFQESGADAHLTKPIIWEKLLSTVKWVLKNVPKEAEVKG
ncbi:MAG: PleD family two-component system response regulator [Candidatus Hydrothermarchaeales archaeon]